MKTETTPALSSGALYDAVSALLSSLSATPVVVRRAHSEYYSAAICGVHVSVSYGKGGNWWLVVNYNGASAKLDSQFSLKAERRKRIVNAILDEAQKLADRAAEVAKAAARRRRMEQFIAQFPQCAEALGLYVSYVNDWSVNEQGLLTVKGRGPWSPEQHMKRQDLITLHAEELKKLEAYYDASNK